MASILGLVLPAMAVLEGDAASVNQDVSHMKAALRVTQRQAYGVHELQSSSGAVIREYVSPAGKVFGVTWQGPVLPDFQQLLGTYFARFSAAPQSRRRSTGPVAIQESGFVLVSGGHMRAFTGKAYIPQMLPEGVGADAIE